MSNQYNEEELDDVVDLKSGVIGRLFKSLKPYWLLILISVLGIALVSFLDAYYTVLSKRIIDEGIVAKNLPVMISLFRSYILVILAQVAGFFIMIYIIGLLGEQLRYDFRKKLFHRLQTLSLSYFSKTPLGWIMSRVTSDTEKMADLLTWGVLDTVWAVTNICFAVYFMLKLSPRLTMIVAVSLVVMIFVSFKFRVKIYHHYRLSRRANSNMTASLNENITGV
ncbi:MAG: ABC transporter transmembrane domain-containing protein, partial [Anaerolineaceae bacterium]